MYTVKDNLIFGFHGCDKLIKDALILDCFLINFLVAEEAQKGNIYDSVRGVFFEGNELYTHAGFREKNHIQISVINPNCIKGYFHVRKIDSSYPEV